MTIHTNSHLHITNLPREIIHQIQDELAKIKGVAGLKSVFNFSFSCRTMREFALNRSRLEHIALRNNILTDKPSKVVLSIANSTKHPLILDSAVQRVQSDLINSHIKINQPDYNKYIDSNNTDVKTTAIDVKVKTMHQMPFSNENMAYLEACLTDKNTQVKHTACIKRFI